MAKAHGLESPQPIMRSTRQSGDCYYMFQSGSKYYLWNLIADQIWEIVREIGKPRYGSLEIKRVYELEESDCD